MALDRWGSITHEWDSVIIRPCCPLSYLFILSKHLEKSHDVPESREEREGGDGLIPAVSYSSSDEDEFYDAEEQKSQQTSPL